MSTLFSLKNLANSLILSPEIQTQIVNLSGKIQKIQLEIATYESLQKEFIKFGREALREIKSDYEKLLSSDLLPIINDIKKLKKCLTQGNVTLIKEIIVTNLVTLKKENPSQSKSVNLLLKMTEELPFEVFIQSLLFDDTASSNLNNFSEVNLLSKKLTLILQTYFRNNLLIFSFLAHAPESKIDERNSSDKEKIDELYREIAQKTHSDRTGSNEKDELFSVATEARKRQDYDTLTLIKTHLDNGKTLRLSPTDTVAILKKQLLDLKKIKTAKYTELEEYRILGVSFLDYLGKDNCFKAEDCLEKIKEKLNNILNPRDYSTLLKNIVNQMNYMSFDKILKKNNLKNNFFKFKNIKF